MFEHQQNKMDELIKDNEDFRRIYNRHQELDKRVTAAELGTAPMEDLALNQFVHFHALREKYSFVNTFDAYHRVKTRTRKPDEFE